MVKYLAVRTDKFAFVIEVRHEFDSLPPFQTACGARLPDAVLPLLRVARDDADRDAKEMARQASAPDTPITFLRPKCRGCSEFEGNPHARHCEFRGPPGQQVVKVSQC